jgi:hypothetical protein
MGSEIVNVTGSLCLKDTLLVPLLTTKLISVDQLAENLNCVVLYQWIIMFKRYSTCPLEYY